MPHRARRAALPAALSLLLVACATDAPTASSTAEATTEPTVEPTATPEPTPEPTPTPVVLQIDSIAASLVSDLVVRSSPGAADRTTILDGRLGVGDRFFVVDGPTTADGYHWYLAAPLLRADGSAAPFGWIASAHRDGTHWVEPDPPVCGGDDVLAAIVALQGRERLACFGNSSLTFTAPEIRCGAADGPIVYEPSWLAGLAGCGVVADDGGYGVLFRIPPSHDGEVPSSGALEVTGHFDDPAAALCTVRSLDPAVPAPPAEAAVLDCRTQFVLESAARAGP